VLLCGQILFAARTIATFDVINGIVALVGQLLHWLCQCASAIGDMPGLHTGYLARISRLMHGRFDLSAEQPTDVFERDRHIAARPEIVCAFG
jgi:hypothetical protein